MQHIVARDGASVTLWSRSRKQLTDYFPEVAASVRAHLPEQVVLDGELVVRTGPPGSQRLDWEALSLRIHPAASRVAQRAALTPAELDDYSERAAILEYDAGLTRAEADRQAMALVLAKRERPEVLL